MMMMIIRNLHCAIKSLFGGEHSDLVPKKYEKRLTGKKMSSESMFSRYMNGMDDQTLTGTPELVFVKSHYHNFGFASSF